MTNKTLTGKHTVPIKWILTHLFYHVIAASGLRFSSLTHNISSSIEFDDDFFYTSPGLVYGFCNVNPNNPCEDHCSYILETNSNVDSLEHLRFCNITIKVIDENNKKGKILRKHRIIAIDNDKAAISTDYYGVFPANLSILHFSDCRVVPVDVGISIDSKVMAPSNGVIDVLSMADRVDPVLFRTVVDFEGNIIEIKRNDWIPEITRDPYIVLRSPSKGRLVVFGTLDWNHPYHAHIVQLMAVRDDGSTEILKKYPIEDWSFYNKYSISHSYELLSICAANNSVLLCGQHDLNGVLKFETQFTLATSNSSKEEWFKVHNLPGGGFLLAIFRCYEYSYELCPKRALDYFVVKKFDNTGRQVGSMQIWPSKQNLKFYPDAAHFFINEKGEMCLSALDIDEASTKGRINLNVACFDDKDFFN